jgi:cytochrome c oxidase subunit 1
LHAIVDFWLMPTYIAYYTIVPRAIGGRLFSDTMGRIAFILFLIVAMPIGIHHAFEDPQVGAGFKYLHSVFTALVALPTLLTVFTICASVEIAARLRGGKGVIGWLTRGRSVLRHAWLRGRRGADQHELSARCYHP